jgi:flagellar biosynthesis anti-sigma factor FlgM
MNINPTSAATNVQTVNKAAHVAKPVQAQATTTNSPVADRVQVSQTDGFQRLVAMAKDGDIRADKVADIKAQIASGNYDLDAKADVVADRMLEDL